MSVIAELLKTWVYNVLVSEVEKYKANAAHHGELTSRGGEESVRAEDRTGTCQETCSDVCAVVDSRQLFTYTCFARSTLLPGCRELFEVSIHKERPRLPALACNPGTLLSWWLREQFF